MLRDPQTAGWTTFPWPSALRPWASVLAAAAGLIPQAIRRRWSDPLNSVSPVSPEWLAQQEAAGAKRQDEV
jgi:hypothetical protein